MTFLNPAVLLGLAAIAIPILIHLFHRRKARPVEWGAMRFLLSSLASRTRRILLEELLLMVLRCLLIVLLVMAVARLFVPARSIVPWPIVLPALLSAAVLAAVGAVMWARRLVRTVLLGLAALLVGVAVFASSAEYLFQGSQWTPVGGERDIAIIIDGSMSMTLTVEGRPNFQRAVEDAAVVLDSCQAGDTVSLILAGPAPRAPVVAQTSDHEQVASALATLQPVGGSMEPLAALDVAAGALAEGHSAAKRIVLITDGQDIGWDVQNEARWQFLEGSFAQLPAPPEVVCRVLPMPRRYHNAAIGDIAFSRRVVGTDRPAGIDVKVMNCGTETVSRSAVRLTIDGARTFEQPVGPIAPQAAERVRYDVQFDAPGPHVVEARLLAADDMPVDDADLRVVNVLERLPVLLVDGSPSTRPLEGATSFMEIALAPAEGEDRPPDGGGAAFGRYLVEPTVVPITGVRDILDFTQYRLVVLADVSQLPPPISRALAFFVHRGGGLLVAPGRNAAPAFYNAWTSVEGGRVAPCSLDGRLEVGEDPARLGLHTFTHPALTLLAEEGRSDAGDATIEAYWRLAVDEQDGSVRVGGMLDDGSPFLVERKLGEGYVAMTALGLGRRDSNLPTLKCFVPFVHELVYYLSAPMVADANVRAGFPVAFDLLPRVEPVAAEGEYAAQGEAVIVAPSGQRRSLALAGAGEARRAAFAGTCEPGLYRLVLPPDMGGPEGGRTWKDGSFPFVVLREPEESRLSLLTTADFERVGRHVDLFPARTTGEMRAALVGDIPGAELWKHLALCALVTLLGEVAVARWITIQRRSHVAEEISFGVEAVDPRSLRAVLEKRPALQDETTAGAAKP